MLICVRATAAAVQRLQAQIDAMYVKIESADHEADHAKQKALKTKQVV